MNDKFQALGEILSKTKTEVAKVIIGQEDVVNASLIAIFTGNHVLIEGVPGIAKTLLVRTLAQVLGCEFSRIQFTPDLMPADITGTHVYNLKREAFSLVKGPVFTTFLLADEINRATPKTQSALLQAMQERLVTIDRKTHQLSPQFTVFATQNPIEFEGTYPLPEAQKDRFMLKINMDHPEREEEVRLAESMLGESSPEKILEKGEVKAIIQPNILTALSRLLMMVKVKNELIGYIVDIVRATRSHQAILSGAGPRGTQSLILAARSFAAIDNRDYVIPDDIKAMAPHVLNHRMSLRPEYEIEGLTVEEVLQNILEEIAVPR